MDEEKSIIYLLGAAPCAVEPWTTNSQAMDAHHVILQTTQSNLERPWRLVRKGITLATATARRDLEPLAEGDCEIVGPTTP